MAPGDRYWILSEDPDGILQVEAFQVVRVGPRSVHGCRVEEAVRRTPSQGVSGTRRHAYAEVFRTESAACMGAVRGLQQWLARQGRLAVQGELRRRQYLRIVRRP